MRVMIMSDMEGVSGIVAWEQVNGGAAMYEEGRRLYTEEINAAVRGAKAAGATEIVAVDCHGAGGPWTFNSFIPDLLDADCEWVAHHGWTGYTAMLERGCDAALFVGMHAMAGTPDGVLCHTVSGTDWRNVTFNDTLVGETGMARPVVELDGLLKMVMGGGKIAELKTGAAGNVVRDQGLAAIRLGRGFAQ